MDSRQNKKAKYGNKKVYADGMEFDSIKECERYYQLKMLQRAGEITDLECQVKYELIPKSDLFRKIDYKADFRYKDKEGETVVEDVKGISGSPKTVKAIKSSGAYRIFKMKQKLMYYIHGIEVIEI